MIAAAVKKSLLKGEVGGCGYVMHTHEHYAESRNLVVFAC